MKSTIHKTQISRDGFTIIENVLDSVAVDRWIHELEKLFAGDKVAIKNRQGSVYAARNILASLPQCCDISSLPRLSDLLTQILGIKYGLVRGLYFDKHPERTWSLPWHKDLTIAVKANSLSNRSLSSSQFTKPTNKSGVPHVEAPESVLSQMLTLRIHLDQVTDENGPLEVAVGSHLNGKHPDTNHVVKKILMNAGGVLAMRPMLSHASGSSNPETKMHRRTLHLEFAGLRDLPDGYEWYQFLQ